MAAKGCGVQSALRRGRLESELVTQLIGNRRTKWTSKVQTLNLTQRFDHRSGDSALITVGFNPGVTKLTCTTQLPRLHESRRFGGWCRVDRGLQGRLEVLAIQKDIRECTIAFDAFWVRSPADRLPDG